MNYKQQELMYDTITSIAQKVVDILFELEEAATLTPDQTEIISKQLDQLFEEHLEQIINPQYV